MNTSPDQIFFNSCTEFLQKCKGFDFISDNQSFSICIINPFFFIQNMIKICYIFEYYTSQGYEFTFIRLFVRDFNTNFQLISFGFVPKRNYNKFYELFHRILSDKQLFVPEIFFSLQADVETHVKPFFPDAQFVYHRSLFKNFLQSYKILNEWLPHNYSITSLYSNILVDIDSTSHDNLFDQLKSIYTNFPDTNLRDIIHEWKTHYNCSYVQKYSFLKSLFTSNYNQSQYINHWFCTKINHPLNIILIVLLYDSFQGFKYLYQYSNMNCETNKQMGTYLSTHKILPMTIFENMNQDSILYIFSYFLNKNNKIKMSCLSSEHLYDIDLDNFIKTIELESNEDNEFLIKDINILPNYTLSFNYVVNDQCRKNGGLNLNFYIPAIQIQSLGSLYNFLSHQTPKDGQQSTLTMDKIQSEVQILTRKPGRPTRKNFIKSPTDCYSTGIKFSIK